MLKQTISARLAALHRPCIFGILNVTPDSFSDGGAHDSAESALDFAVSLIQDGADAIDIGGESTRPGALPVSDDEEIRRILPPLKAIRARYPGLLISIDTRKSAVAEVALRAGADIINDVSGLQFDPVLASVVAKYDAGLVIMHMRGTPETMQTPENLVYDDLLDDIAVFLKNAAVHAVQIGVKSDNILLDPGVGFSKTDAQNMQLIHSAAFFHKLGFPLFYGISRKGFIGRMYHIPSPVERDTATAELQKILIQQGVQCLRVHNPRTVRQALKAPISD